MRATRKLLKRLGCDRKAATAVEYGLITALIAVALVLSMIALGNASGEAWGNILAKYVAAAG